MRQESSPPGQELEQRVRCLRELAASLESARSAVLRSDLAELTRHTVRQRELCANLERIGIPHAAAERWRDLLQESNQMELRVASLNREFGALLARARRTVDIFCRILGNAGATYRPPKPETASRIARLEL